MFSYFAFLKMLIDRCLAVSNTDSIKEDKTCFVRLLGFCIILPHQSQLKTIQLFKLEAAELTQAHVPGRKNAVGFTAE